MIIQTKGNEERRGTKDVERRAHRGSYNKYCLHLAANSSGIRIEEAGKSQDRMAELQISHCEIPEAFCVDRDDLQLLPQSLISHETES